MARLLLANGNTSVSVTEALATAARAAASPGTQIVTATAAYGVPVIQSAADLAIAHRALLDAVRDHMQDCDGLLVGVSLDLALEELRQQWPLPVVGMTGAALAVADRQGWRAGLIVSGENMAALVQQRFPAVHPMLIEVIDVSPVSAWVQRGDPALLLDLLAAAAERLADRGAHVVLPIGATVAGLAPHVHASVPVLDCIACAVNELERLVHAPGRAAA